MGIAPGITTVGKRASSFLTTHPLGAIHAQALQFQRLHRGNIHTDGEVQLRGMHAKGELRGHLGWNSDIIQPWGHDHRGAIAMKRLRRHAMYGFVILVTRDTGRAEGDHHLGLQRHHDPPHVVGERFTVGGAALVIAVVQEDRRVGPMVIFPRRWQ